jgi:ATP-dependent Clp protease ATP-binding subunit ClpB
MTSNLGSLYLLDGVTDHGEIKPDAREHVFDELSHQFRPEFLNRVDDIVLFKPLTASEIERIVDLLLEDVRSRLAERRVSLDIDEEARRHIARKGFDPVYGARPLRRFIAHDVETRIARALLAGEVHDGSTITVRVQDGELVVSAGGPSDQEEINNTQ